MNLEPIDYVFNNDKIAEFMGGKPVEKFFSCDSWDIPDMSGYQHALFYHNSWDWLMPVIFKCHDLGLHFDSQFTQCELRAYCSFNQKLFYESCNDYPDVIGMTYRAVVKFIDGYNEYIENEKV